MIVFKSGDLVKAKSGGPELVVEQTFTTAIGGAYYRCYWYDQNGKLRHVTCQHEVLVRVNDK